jgi:general secretion pathway protein D
VDVYDGTTIVLGGLLSEETTAVLSKVPFLGDIPILGRAFQREMASTERQHLLVFITVNVLDSRGNPYFSQEDKT